MLVSLTFEFNLQYFIFVLDDVTVGIKGVTGTVHTDLQAKISLCRAQGEDHIQSNGIYSVFLLLIYCLYIICAEDYSQTVINQSIRIFCMQFMLVADQVLCNPVPCQMYFHINTDCYFFTS